VLGLNGNIEIIPQGCVETVIAWRLGDKGEKVIPPRFDGTEDFVGEMEWLLPPYGSPCH
jgi:hypothetical protein